MGDSNYGSQRPAKPGRIRANITPYHGESLVPGFASRMHGLDDFYRMQQRGQAAAPAPPAPLPSLSPHTMQGPAAQWQHAPPVGQSLTPSGHDAYPGWMPPPWAGGNMDPEIAMPAPWEGKDMDPGIIARPAYPHPIGSYPEYHDMAYRYGRDGPDWRLAPWHDNLPGPPQSPQREPILFGQSHALPPGPGGFAPSAGGWNAAGAPQPVGPAQGPSAAPLPYDVRRRDGLGNVQYHDGSQIQVQPDGSRSLTGPYGTGSATDGPRTQPTTIEGMPASDWFVKQAERQKSGNAYANYDPTTGQASVRTGPSIEGIPSGEWFKRQAQRQQTGNAFADYDPVTGQASTRTGPSVGGMPASDWFTREAQQQKTSNRYATFDPATQSATPVRNVTPQVFPASDAGSAKAMQVNAAPAMPPSQSATTPGSVTTPKLPTAPQDDKKPLPLAARALRPPGHSVPPREDLSNPLRPRATVPKGWRPKPGAVLPGSPPKLHPIAAYALRPRATVPKGWRPKGYAGLQAAPLVPVEEVATSAPIAPVPSPFAPKLPLNSGFTTNPNSYLQPGQASPQIGDAPPADGSSSPAPLASGYQPRVGIATDPLAPREWQHQDLNHGTAWGTHGPTNGSPWPMEDAPPKPEADILHTPSSQWFTEAAQRQQHSNVFATYDPATGAAVPIHPRAPWVPRAPSPPDIAMTSDPHSLLQPGSEPLAQQSPRGPQPNPRHIPTADDPVVPLTPEEENRRKLWGDIVDKAYDLERFGKQDFGATRPPKPDISEPVFDKRVMTTLSNIVPYIKLYFSPENRVGMLAATKFVAEENATRTGLKGLIVDGLQDSNAASGHARYDVADFHHDDDQLPSLRVPENWVKGNWAQKVATQTDPLLHDLGPANIKLKTAAELESVTRADDLRQLAKILTTDAGTARITSQLVHNAMTEVGPMIKDKPEDEQAQIIVDYMRRGPEAFWGKVKERRGMSDDHLQRWKSNPSHFVLPDGSSPQSLEPDPDHFKQSQFKQLREKLSTTPQSKPPAMWQPTNY